MLRKYSALAVLAVILMISPAVSAVNFSDDVRIAADNFPDEIRIGVMEFSSGTMDLVPEQAIVVGNIFTQRLAMSAPDNITVVGHGQLSRVAEENHMSTEGYVSNRNAARIGQLAGCRYIIAGIATDLKTRSASTGVHFIVKLGQNVSVATAVADIRLIDTETGESLLSISDTARATQKESNFGVNTSEVLDMLPQKTHRDVNKNLGTQVSGALKNSEATFSRSGGGMEAASMFLLSSRLSLKVIEAITGKYPSVLSVSKNEVMLNIGSNGGAKTEMLYRIFSPEGNIAVVQLKDVQSNTSRATLYSKGYGKLSLVKPGDRVFPTDIYEAKALVKGKTFIRKRDDIEKKSKSSAAKAKRTKAKRERKIETITQGDD